MRIGLKIGAWVSACALAAVAYSLYVGPWLQETRVQVPSERDPELTGTWSTHRLDSKGGRVTRTTILSSDGIGNFGINTDFKETFRWGTDHGVLVVKLKRNGAWTNLRFPYNFSKGRNIVSFAGSEAAEIVQPEMDRLVLRFNKGR